MAFDDTEPTVHYLIGYWCAPFGLLSEPRIVPGDEVADYRRFGWIAIPDPDDEAAMDLWTVRQSEIHRRGWR